tara:strand:+ start:1300 stop:1515 length:216 start_codon:yes stop_codon:yes gene_type:complete
LKKKKPTNKQIETVISNIIQQLQVIEQKVNALDNLIGLYFEWKKDTDKFNKFVQGRLKELQDKNKTGDKQK